MSPHKIEFAPLQDLELTETPRGYVFAEGANAATQRVMGRFLGLSFILAGLGLLAVPVAGLWFAKTVLAVLLVVTGGVFAARGGISPRAEIEVDLEKRLLRKRRRVGKGQAHLVAQFPFASVTGFDVDGDGRLAALFVESGGQRRAILTGAPEALRNAAVRIGADLLADRGLMQGRPA